MSIWTHVICEKCWKDTGHDFEPTRFIPPETEICCYCGVETNSGIYIRNNPDNVAFCNHDGLEQKKGGE